MGDLLKLYISICMIFVATSAQTQGQGMLYFTVIHW